MGPIAVIVAVGLIYEFAGGCGHDEWKAAGEAVVPVVRVVDGDTIKVRYDGEEEYVRYIGIDTPESVKPGSPVECFGPEAKELNERLVGDRVRLVFDRERRDRYGRLLAYVYSGPGMVNGALVRRGYATAYAVPPNDHRAGFFERLEERARATGRGLWSAC